MEIHNQLNREHPLYFSVQLRIFASYFHRLSDFFANVFEGSIMSFKCFNEHVIFNREYVIVPFCNAIIHLLAEFVNSFFCIFLFLANVYNFIHLFW